MCELPAYGLLRVGYVGCVYLFKNTICATEQQQQHEWGQEQRYGQIRNGKDKMQ